ncbi:hypothetical protein M9H77_21126 [Catharanthus roseus]|uniref:Uncharacterized protein n=1 Tax=Catharanthus roseus TaxID=4058 RepID=A0ACC0APD0_CATRO|nr:hypothetical protein M9H77_21126 [Catharanthus roseus]
MNNLRLLFKRGKKEGTDEPHFSLITASTTMGSPSHSQQEVNPQSQEQGEEELAEELPQTLDSVKPTVQSDATKSPRADPDHEVILDQREEEEAADEDQENSGMLSSAFSAPSIGSNVSHLTMTPSPCPPTKRGNKGKRVHTKKQKAIDKKVQTLLEKLNPIPFIPSKILDFAKHEKLLKRLGLWDFVHIEFDRDIRVDLIAQLVINYDNKRYSSSVNGSRIQVTKAELAKAFNFKSKVPKVPVKKDNSYNVVVDGVDLDEEAFSEESITFLEDFVSNWVLLHEDAWIMPSQVLTWTKAIKDGHPEKVDWVTLFWSMIREELKKGEQLVDCYYVSHLQYLIKSQKKELFWRDEAEVGSRDEPERVDLGDEPERVDLGDDPEKVDFGDEPEKVDLSEEVKEEDGGANEDNVKTGSGCEVPEEEDGKFPGPNVELTLGQDAGEEEMRDANMVDIEDAKEDAEEQDHENSHWLLDGKNNAGQHFMQRCSVEESKGLDSLQEGKEEGHQMEVEDEEGEEADDGFDVVTGEFAVGGEGLTGNFLQAMETTQIAFGSQGQLHDQSSVDLLESRNDLQHMSTGGPSYYIHNGKRAIGHEHEIAHHSLNGSNKRLRTDGPWDHRPLDFGTCMDQMQHLVESARMMYEEKKQVLEDSNLQKQILVNEMQKRDAVIEHLHKTKCEEVQKRDVEIFRLQRELYLMGKLLEEYREALKESDSEFAEYRQRYQLAEEPIYQDAGPGGVMMSTAEIEKQRLQQEEYRNNCLLLEQKAKEIEEAFALQFGEHLDKVTCFDRRLAGLESGFKVLRDLHTKCKVSEMEKIPEAAECPPSE